LSAGENAGGRGGLLPDLGRDFRSKGFEIFDCRNDVTNGRDHGGTGFADSRNFARDLVGARPLC